MIKNNPILSNCPWIRLFICYLFACLWDNLCQIDGILSPMNTSRMILFLIFLFSYQKAASATSNRRSTLVGGQMKCPIRARKSARLKTQNGQLAELDDAVESRRIFTQQTENPWVMHGTSQMNVSVRLYVRYQSVSIAHSQSREDRNQ